ncbi:SRPBCC domain-containing protein [Lysinibacillus louembei]|uniref:SRPBCC domain-containing protein n=1 Tax=Lysinibacillus louembei TaxID=1470088 RepID=A0ABZ0S1W5_9BACI|nr:SRPBCC domain-containing protein [Lysinibacillus louembei]WPK13281.1 SRPBCC domain-containing protein [Lysinibacillus louembei]
MEKERIIGQTKGVGFQIGVRRTFPISQEKAWEFITSEEGVNLWLGESSDVIFQPGEHYTTKMGTGEIRIVKQLEQLRLTWQKEGWERPSTIQVRIIAKASDKTTISFHQEHLSDENVREEMKMHWEIVLNEIGARL